MRIITYNVNGIRSAIKRGFIDWLNTDPADIVCLQEIKANREDIAIESILRTHIANILYSLLMLETGYVNGLIENE